MTNQQRTGEILPRSYGIRLSMPATMPDVFVSPAAYILGQIMLETPSEIRARVRDWAGRHGKDYSETIENLVSAVVKREGTKNLLNYSRRTINRQKHNLTLQNMKHYGGQFTGEVKSKGKEGYYTFSIPEPQKREVNVSYPGARVGNSDNLWNEGKGKNMSVIGVHLAIPEIALVIDDQTEFARNRNITGLSPRERKMQFMIPLLPFRFNRFRNPLQLNAAELIQYRLVTDFFMDYYLNETSQYRMSISALESDIFSEGLKTAIVNSHDRGKFKVLRQREEERNIEDLSSSRRRHYASLVTLVDRIKDYLEKEWEYVPAGYMREFVGSPWETVSRRFEPKGDGPVYSVSIADSRVPILVRRYLGHKSRNWMDSYDNQIGHPLTSIKRKYNSIDDVTRREAITEVVLPDKQLKEKGFVVPQNLQEIYDSLRRGE